MQQFNIILFFICMMCKLKHEIFLRLIIVTI